MDYKQAGVDVEAGYKSVELIKGFVKGTYRKEVLGGLGGFGGLFSIEAAKGMEHPILVSGTDGVGTKLKIAFLMDKHDTVGIDCVAMCANDIVCCGAEPLFFLDYIACDKNLPEKIAQIVKGVTEGCLMSGMSLIGGETAEMPGLYRGGEYDIAGFATGIVDQAKIIDGSSIKVGDTLIGVASSGLHSNGFSLVRKAFRISEQNINEHVQELGCRLGEELIKPTKIYVKPILELIKRVKIKGISNITGGGFIENIPRMMPQGVNAKINLGSWEILPIFKLIENLGNVKMKDMYNTFNMGIGMVIAVDSSDAQAVIDLFREFSDKAWIIGSVIKGEENGVCFA